MSIERSHPKTHNKGNLKGMIWRWGGDVKENDLKERHRDAGRNEEHQKRFFFKCVIINKH